MTHEGAKKASWLHFLLGALLAFLLVIFFRQCNRPDPQPRLGGQAVPTQTFQINFSKRYRIICHGYEAEGGPRIYNDVRILGFVGGDSGKGNSTHFASYSYFGHWLVLEKSDLKKVYLPASSIAIIEEVSNKSSREE